MSASGGEPVGRGGYPASTFASIARLVESAGSFTAGSISLVATVLNDGDDRDPVSEAARSLLDGHIQLSTKLADAGRFPAVDVLASASRTMAAVAGPEHQAAASTVRRALSALAETVDLRALGVETKDPEVCAALSAQREIDGLLLQGLTPSPPQDALAMLFKTADTLREPHGHHF
jgi:flagellar biosynthesis/type III secretory pathway ATPase